MTKGLRRKLLAMWVEELENKGAFKKVIAHAPQQPFPAREDFPCVFVALTPSTVRPETENEQQTDFRFASVILLEAKDDLDLAKCDLIDELEEAFYALQARSDFVAEFAQVWIDQIDPGTLALAVFGFDPLIIEAPFGAVRVDHHVDFHYAG